MVERTTMDIILLKLRSLWDTLKGPPPDIKGKNFFTPYSGFTPGTLVFTYYTTARQRYLPRRTVIDE